MTLRLAVGEPPPRDLEDLLAAGRFPVRSLMQALDRQPGAQRLEVLRKLATDTTLAPHTRLIAVHAVRLDRDGGARHTLRSLLTDDAPPEVAAAAAVALGQVGDAEDLDALARVAAGRSPPLARLAGFARLLIAHRTGRGDVPLILPAPDRLVPARDGAPALVPGELSSRHLGTVLASVAEQGYDVALDPSFASVVECAGVTLIVALDTRLAGRLSDVLPERPAVLGIVAAHRREDHSAQLRLILLSAPNKRDHADLAAFQITGVAWLAGTAEAGKGTVTFDLRALPDTGVGATIQGRAGDGRVMFTRAHIERHARAIEPGRLPPFPG